MWSSHHREFSHCSYEYLENNPLFFYRLYTNPSMLIQYFYKKTDGTPSPVYTQMYKNGWDTDYGMKSGFKWANEKEAVKQKKISKSVETELNMHKALQDLKESSEIVKTDALSPGL